MACTCGSSRVVWMTNRLPSCCLVRGIQAVEEVVVVVVVVVAVVVVLVAGSARRRQKSFSHHVDEMKSRWKND